jgi:hypothetical protein
MLRAKLGLEAALLGFWLLLMEFGFALYGEFSFHRLANSTHMLVFSAGWSLPERVIFHLPVALLALASLICGIAVYRAIQGGPSWIGYVAALSPLAAFLVIYKPPVSHSQFILVKEALLPWAAPIYWTDQISAQAGLRLVLQIAMYVAAVALALAVVLAFTRRHARGRDVSNVPVSTL